MATEIKTKKKAPEVDPYRKAVSVKRAAEVLDCSNFFIYDLIAGGELERVKIRSRTYVTIKSLEQLQTPK